MHGMVYRYCFEGCPSDQLWVPHSGFLACHPRCRCSGQHVEGVYQHEETAEQVQPWVPHGGCNDRCRPAHFAEGGRVFVSWRVTNHGYPVLIIRPTVCRVSVFRGIGMVRVSHLAVGDQLADYPMLQLTCSEYYYFQTSFLKGWRPDIVWH